MCFHICVLKIVRFQNANLLLTQICFLKHIFVFSYLCFENRKISKRKVASNTNLLLKAYICIFIFVFWNTNSILKTQTYLENSKISKHKFASENTNLLLKTQIYFIYRFVFQKANSGWNFVFTLKLWDTHPLGVSARLERFE